MFKPVSPKLNVTLMEEGVLRFWKSHDIFHQSMDARQGGPEYVFYEGPPTANGTPGRAPRAGARFQGYLPAL